MTIVKHGWNKVKGLWSDEAGQGMVEYGLILALVSVVAIIVLALLGGELKEVFQDVIRHLEGRTPSS